MSLCRNVKISNGSFNVTDCQDKLHCKYVVSFLVSVLL